MMKSISSSMRDKMDRNLPKEYLNIGGIQTTLVGDTAAGREFIPAMRSLFFRMELTNNAGLPQYWMEEQLDNGGVIKVSTNHGIKRAYIYIPPVIKLIPEKYIEKYLHTLTDAPVPCFDLFNGQDFTGFYVCGDKQWNTLIMLPADEERPYERWDYADINADGEENQFTAALRYQNLTDYYQIYPLKRIGEEESGQVESDYDSTYTSQSITWTPGISTTEPWWISIHNCPKRYGDPVFITDDTGTYWGGGFSMLSTICVCDLCDEPYIYQWGADQHGIRWTLIEWTDYIKVGDLYLFQETSGRGYTEYEHTCTNFGETSLSTHTKINEGSSSYILNTSFVTGTEGYEDNTVWIVFWTEYESDYNETVECSPWASGPVFNDFPDLPAETVVQKYKLYCKTPDYVIEEEFALESFYAYSTSTSPSTGSMDDITVHDVNIFDFHGEPVFVFCWFDDRTEEFQYCMIFKGETYYSPIFPELSFWDHDVYDSLEKYNSYGMGYARASGLRKVYVSKSKWSD